MISSNPLDLTLHVAVKEMKKMNDKIEVPKYVFIRMIEVNSMMEGMLMALDKGALLEELLLYELRMDAMKALGVGSDDDS